MEFQNIVAIVIACIASAGGIGGIIIAVVKFCSDLIADRLSAKYEAKLQKEMERYKVQLNKKGYVSKTRFDAEFLLFQQLSKAFFEMVKGITIMIPYGLATYPSDEKKRKEYENGLHATAFQATVVAQDILNGNIPFIQEKIYNECNEILSLCKMQLDAFERRWNVLYFSENKEYFTDEETARSKEIDNKFKSLCVEMRTYLSNLDIIE